MTTSIPESPLTGSRNVELVGRVPTRHLIDLYAKQFDTDVREAFDGLSHVEVFKCRDSGYRFYYPFEVAGGERFYDSLNSFPFYYEAQKWEHSVALRWVAPEQRVLDVGCGAGAFLERVSSVGARAVGLELNSKAAQRALEAGLTVHQETIEAHAEAHPAAYDVVTSFQVLEHVPAVRSFLAACVEALRPGGTLVLGVPNNDGFLQFDPDAVLNAPPHHVGLWDRASLEALTKFFPLELTWLEYEPLNNPEWYQTVMEARYLPKARWFRSAYHRFGGASIVRKFLDENRHTIVGHTVLAAYRRRE